MSALPQTVLYDGSHHSQERRDLTKWYCTRCDRQSEAVPVWRCPSCASRHRSRNDRATVDALCRQWRGLPVSEARKVFRRYGAGIVAARVGCFDDLKSVATMGLLKAARMFDESRGFQFSTYATTAIQHTLWFALREIDRNRGTTVSLSTAKEGGIDVADPRAAEPIDGVSRAETSATVREAIGRLRARHAWVVTERIDGKKLHEIATELGVTHERVRQIEMVAFAKLAESLARPE